MLANAEKGELSMTVDGKRYILTLVTRSMVELEDVTGGRTFLQCWEGIQTRKSLKDICCVLWTALRARHKEIATEAPDAITQIADFIDRAGGLEPITEQLTALLRLHTQPKELQDGGGMTARPPDAAASSISPGDVSVSPDSAAA
jgi:hypothetical protein